MDKSEHGILSGIPPDALSVHLTRSTIKMHHGAAWRVDKSNEVHDLVVCLTGNAAYEIDDDSVEIGPGEAMLIPAEARFRGRRISDSRYTGIAQHFTLKLFGSADLISQMDLRHTARLSDWHYLEPLVQHYNDTAPATSTTLAQHHAFMVILTSFIGDAFLGWRQSAMASVENRDALSLHIMLLAARISADPMNAQAIQEANARVPYNPEYFRRAFRERFGFTPQKFVELKKMERAIHYLALGRTVQETAADLGYRDPYYFSRMFKRFIGASPSSYRLRADVRRLRQNERYFELME
ncbi:helix-turn-helix domain-containing protein [Tropicimonas sp. TH_r6]|uniref:AraC family transcriptional regulator n=1 Tax=Tropicimonas sp. TH_r6 TaxID=3082085 RepID=UPI00295482CE|nr:helix-turn-helix domain-containing protein [Tropicimonas sp. TH_r6]MDV7144839.1 helix-turn-helix domain-containing protein [Tropicimonas sp. TH_r6]